MGEETEIGAPKRRRRGAGVDDSGPVDTELPLDLVTNPCSLTLPVFEGPLDLLLHFIREHRLNIFDIPIAFVTQEFIDYLDVMKHMNLDVAGEYLRMAATLAYIKSRMMLPVPEVQEEDEEADPREELVRRLLTYQQFKDASADLSQRPQVGREIFTRASRELYDMPAEDAPLVEVGVFQLLKAYMSIHRRIRSDVTQEITAERVTIAQRIFELVDMISEVRERPFSELLAGCGSVDEVITTFLALLEMAKLRMVRVFQVEQDGEIYVKNTMEPAEADAKRLEISRIEYR